MDPAISAITYSVASTLLPLAYYGTVRCWNKVRDPIKIRKSVLVIPNKGGKTVLKSKLNCNELMVVDMDEAIESVLTTNESKRLNEYKVNNELHQYDIDYKEVADKILNKTKTHVGINKKKRILYITSCWLFASQFKHDAIYIACPDVDFLNNTILEGTTPEEKNTIMTQREYFLDSLPNRRAINSYHTFEQLEELVRGRLKLHHKI